MVILFRVLKFVGFVILLLIVSSPISAEEVPQGQIEWELVNPFRLFHRPEHTALHRKTYEELTSDEQETPILSVERRLSSQNQYGWARTVYDKTCWSRTKGRYYKCAGKKQPYIHPKSHKIWLEYKNSKVSQDAPPRVAPYCSWSMIYTQRKRKRVKTQKALCDQRVQFDIPYPTGAVIELKVSNGISLSEKIKIKDIFIVGIGDSFASGEGNPDVPVRFSAERSVFYQDDKEQRFEKKAYPTRVGKWKDVADRNFMKYKARWQGQSCHRSLYSHQMRASLQLALEKPKRAVTFAGFACAGAQITHGLFLRFKGNEWSETPPKLSQISAVAEAQCGARRAENKRYSRAFGLDGKLEILNDLPVKRCARKNARRIDLLMVSIGGNDVSFSSLVANVVVKDSLQLKTVGGWMGAILDHNQAKARIAELRLRYKALRRALHNVLLIPWGEADRVLLTAYPNMTFRDKGKRVCDDGALGMDLSPLFSLSSKKASDAEGFAESLNDAMRREAKNLKWTYVEGHRDAFTSHGICAQNEEKKGELPEILALPYKEQGQWQPYNPSEYVPYASRERWFRTPNDAYLTGHLHLSGAIMSKFKKLRPLQVLVAGTYSGAFHPTAEGQAVIADALSKAANKVLAKYGQ
jgi:lysophospholipase L1-like esterase